MLSGRSIDQYREFVATDAEELALWRDVLGDLLQKFVSGLVAAGIVERLEAVDV